MRSGVLASCSALALVAGLMGFAGSASANSYNFTTVQMFYGVKGPVSATDDTATAINTPANTGIGQLYLSGGTSAPQYVYCLDLLSQLGGGTYSTNTLPTSPSTAPYVVPNANVTLTDFQVQQIGAIAYQGSLAIGSASGNQNKDITSAATQAAIWGIEYGQYGPFSIGSATGLNGGQDDLAAVNSLLATFLSNVHTSTSSWLNNLTYTVTLLTPTDPATNQALGFTSSIGKTGELPLPAGLPLFAAGLLGLELIRRRRKHKSSMSGA